MKKTIRPRTSPRRAAKRNRILAWTIGLGVLALAVYGVSQMSNIVYTEDDIKVVDFSVLDRAERTNALEAANAARCPCSCNMTLAQCVSTDSTCPLRITNIDRIKVIVQQANES